MNGLKSLTAMLRPVHVRNDGEKPPMRFRQALTASFAAAVAITAAITAAELAILRFPHLQPQHQITTSQLTDLIKNALALVAGAGAVIALVTTYRRQKTTERAQIREQTRIYNERFTTASSQLADANPAIRIAGIYAMAGLADDWEHHRQTCIDVLCANLRIPYPPEPPADASPTDHATWLATREARHTLIRVITAHLQPDDRRAPAHTDWSHFTLDFTSVTFDGGDFNRARFNGKVSFRHAQFTGDVDFRWTHFSGAANFNSAQFAPGCTVNFYAARVTDGGTVDFLAALFAGGTVGFYEARFTDGAVSFSNARFSGCIVAFTNAQFDATVYFTGARFSGGIINFDSAQFTSAVHLDSTRFTSGTVNFSHAQFTGGAVNFDSAQFIGSAVDFTTVRLDGGTIDFSNISDWSTPPRFNFTVKPRSLLLPRPSHRDPNSSSPISLASRIADPEPFSTSPESATTS